MSAALARLLDEALGAMNDAVRLTAETGSSARGMEYVANWLNSHDAVDEDVAGGLSGLIFPPDPPRTGGVA